MQSSHSPQHAIEQQFVPSHYQLGKQIGIGGFGTVYQATQISTNQTVAIKFLTLPHIQSADKRQRLIERFEREIKLCSMLRHPNAVSIIDKGQVGDDLIYAVFEYVEGITLKDKIQQQGSLDANETAQVMMQVLDCLAHAHEQGIVHRDIKPANIMLTKQGVTTHAKILDFGIGTFCKEARHPDHKTITMTSETLGTPSYSAPEQLRGEPPTSKSDLYAWGLVFLECLTGRPAISGNSLAAIFHKQLNQSNVPLPVEIAGHPISDLLSRVLKKAAIERLGDAAAVYAQLQKLNFTSLLTKEQSQSIPLAMADAVDMDDETQFATNSWINVTQQAERRQITALAVLLRCQATEHNDLEENVIEALFREQKHRCIDIASRYGGFHVGSLADTLLFYFGYPTISDNDARLCARTALDIVSSIHQNNSLTEENSHGIEVDVSIGIHTGIMTFTADEVPEGMVAGKAMELARSQQSMVLCSAVTANMLDSFLEFSNQDNPDIRQLKGEKVSEAFGFLRGKNSHLAIIGRQQELDQLNALLQSDRAQPKQNHYAHVYGEAGIGKSRLIFELRNQTTQVKQYIAQCLPEYSYNALLPILNLIRSKYLLHALSGESLSQRFIELWPQVLQQQDTNTTNPLPALESAIPLLSTWFAVPLPEEFDALSLPPEVQLQLFFQVLSALVIYHPAEQLQGLTQEYHLIIVEDLHWADITTIQFLAKLIQDPNFIAAGHVLISTSRQTVPTQLAPHCHHQIAIQQLDGQQSNQLICHLLDNDKVAKRVLEAIGSRASGVPLFRRRIGQHAKAQPFSVRQRRHGGFRGQHGHQ